MSQQQPLLNGAPSPYRDRFDFINQNYYSEVLDIGAKNGFIQPDKADRKIVGCDIDEYRVPHYTRFVKANVEEGLPFKDKEFKCVVAAEVLQYFHDPLKALKELKRVTAETILFTVAFEHKWDPKNHPFEKLAESAKTHGVSLEEQEALDTQGRVSGPKEAEYAHLYPQRSFTLDSLLKLFDEAELRYRVKLLDYSGFSFFVGTCYRE